MPNDILGNDKTNQPKPDLTADDVLNLMNDDTDDKDKNDKEVDDEDNKDNKDNDKEDNKDKTDKEDELDLEEKNNEEDELDDEKDEDKEKEELEKEIKGPARRKQILAKYPNLQKEFPELFTEYFKAQQLKEVVGSVDDAKEIVAKAEQFDTVAETLNSGSNETLLKSLKEDNPRAFARLVDNYLPDLMKVDQGAFYHIYSTLVSKTIENMIAKSDKNPDLKIAAELLNEFVFDNKDLVKPDRFSKEDTSKEKSDLDKERESFNKERYQVTYTELANQVTNTVRDKINEVIDPNKSMPDFVRKHAVNDCKKLLDEKMGSDREFNSKMNKLWDKAIKSGYSTESKQAIKSAYYSKARTILPELIKRTRQEALRGLKVREEKDRRGPIEKGRSTSFDKSRQNTDKGKGIPKGMSVRDFIEGD